MSIVNSRWLQAVFLHWLNLLYMYEPSVTQILNLLILPIFCNFTWILYLLCWHKLRIYSLCYVTQTQNLLTLLCNINSELLTLLCNTNSELLTLLCNTNSEFTYSIMQYKPRIYSLYHVTHTQNLLSLSCNRNSEFTQSIM